ncbi:TetR/AcrR family transcriptional regulator [Spirillospora sp. CA-294931]|uniref:TetR/AcrR family transcriptional regulator n=1 Tax=Spirillospora sp. CA-294931 TaxID=3240042 RepID=UPI003D9397E8
MKTRGRGTRGLSRDEVLDVTMALAERGGLDAVSMRAVADRLDVTPMALYRYVDGKQGLLDGLVERMMAEMPADRPDLPWQDRMRAFAAAIRQVARRHPELFLLMFTRPTVTDEARRPRAAVQDMLRAAGVPEAIVPPLQRLLDTVGLGMAASEAHGRFSGTPEEVEEVYQLAEEIFIQAIERYASD